MKSKPHIAVVGAGAFGGWTALHLLERGARVTLLDAWGPGNSRASSGGETRIMRGAYGPDQPYTEMAARALKLWAKYERRWKRRFLHRIGVLWMASSNDDAFERGSLKPLRQAGIKFQELSARELKKRWPQVSFEGIDWGIYEPECGYIEARSSCQAVVEAFVAGGGKYRQLAVMAEGVDGAGFDRAMLDCATSKSLFLAGLVLSDGSRLKADYYVFACGPWLGKLFPETIGDLVRATKQDIFFFGTPAGDPRFNDSHLPVWGDHREHFFYGIPGSDRRGFKVADDTRGPAFDPTSGERVVSPETLRGVREHLAFRFPAMKDAPLIETRVCQYEQTPDEHFIVDRHPRMENAWLLGGGSGHGFKHGPAVGEMMAELILKEREAEPRWRLSRFPNGNTT
ncbi:MAG TPA: FAD-dependent oxidoreductase [Candidatus Sulfotelmatobacter sp.]|nr:FAD-dependent oxidoreductase [Candidatus Sulfotelmatobacter sp.]